MSSIRLFLSLFLIALFAGCGPSDSRAANVKESTDSNSVVFDGDAATLKISAWPAKTLDALPLYAMESRWKPNWVAFARRVPAPYHTLKVSAEPITDDWIVISPDERFANVKSIYETDVTGENRLATRRVSEYIQASDYQDLIRIKDHYWVEESSMWVDSVFMDGTLHFFYPDLSQTLANGPHQLVCGAAGEGSYDCILHHRYVQIPPKFYKGLSFPSTDDLRDEKDSFFARLTIMPAGSSHYNFALCSRSVEVCELAAMGHVEIWSRVESTCEEMDCYGLKRGTYRCEAIGCYAL